MGLIGGMARTAVVAGTATAVSNRVSRRQASRWALRTNRRTTSSTSSSTGVRRPSAATAPAAAAVRHGRQPGQLEKLGELKAAGVLTEEEFAAQKAKILAQ